MSTFNQVLAAAGIARMVKNVPFPVFNTDDQNGFFITAAGQKLIEFETLATASTAVVQLNSAILPILLTIKNSLETRMNNLL